MKQSKDLSPQGYMAWMVVLSCASAMKTSTLHHWLATIPSSYITIFSLSRAYTAVCMRMRSSTKFKVHHATGIVGLLYPAIVWYKRLFTADDEKPSNWLVAFDWWFHLLAVGCTVVNLVSSVFLLPYLPRNLGAQYRRAFLYGIPFMASSVLLQYAFHTANQVNQGTSPLVATALHASLCITGWIMNSVPILMVLLSFATIFLKPEPRKKTRSIWVVLTNSFFETDNENEATKSMTIVLLIVIALFGLVVSWAFWNLLLHPNIVNVGEHTNEVLRYNDVAFDLINLGYGPSMMFDVTRIALGQVSGNKSGSEIVLGFFAISSTPFVLPGIMLSPEVCKAYYTFLGGVLA
mmetsp:Transcript_12655/g.35090  ORF Transcript_12655/g.35090 Transcript_12655/m.35090 type:complete len:349 (-) Transcript_12655:105-1151(-)|eukprot:CAMPEP_0168717486 /NCGR_PEP_ID=MMETSP0724-20121128/25_1 /TAXON_ID=265536 /ORGANISM="Amphiprora sp., Strain CCMP467" /LENGTH=348 /DNA_ID=CAMNT_0008763965 /DNA_START=43 /DNA_END=1089 /DNA_ORIENTATION=-